jgi:hypothetical protein
VPPNGRNAIRLLRGSENFQESSRDGAEELNSDRDDYLGSGMTSARGMKIQSRM